MRVGLHFQLPSVPGRSSVQRFRETIEQATIGEELGFDSVWPVEQHFDAEASMLSAPLLLLAAIAERTSTMRLGSAVMLAPLVHPIRLAEEMATLDVLSDGRAECGIGRGMDPTHFAGYGVEHPAATSGHQQLVELVAILRTAWAGKAVHRSSPPLAAASVVPQPVNGPPKIRIAANSLDTFMLAGRLGLPILTASHVNPPARLAALLDGYREMQAACGHQRSDDDVTVLVPTFTHADSRVIRRTVEPGVARIGRVLRRKIQTWIDLEPAGPDAELRRANLGELAERLSGFGFDSLAASGAVFEAPSRCAERFEELTSTLGIDRFICWFNPGGLIEHERVIEAMETFAGHVAPNVSHRAVDDAAA